MSFDTDVVVWTYLDRCERVGRQETFSDLAEALHATGGSAEEIFHGIRWLFGNEYALRTRPNEFVLTDKGREALQEFRRASADPSHLN